MSGKAASDSSPLRWWPQDSEVATIERDGADLLVHLAVVQVERPEPEHPLRWQSGHLPGGVLRFVAAELSMPWAPADRLAAAGRLRRWVLQTSAGQTLPARLPWPLRLDGPLHADLELADGTHLALSAAALTGDTGRHGGREADDGFMESLAC